jgi:rod shape-determining protein MreD
MKGPINSLTKPLRPARDYRSRLNRRQSPFKMLSIPIASVLLASMITCMPIIASQAVLPPLGLMVFLAWRLSRPGMWPMWVGLPFGLFDDMMSGQPFGSAGLLWSLAMLAIELIDTRAAWRDYWQDWLIASLIITICLFAGLWFVGMAYVRPSAVVILPQVALSILLYPLVARLVSRLDRWRLST